MFLGDLTVTVVLRGRQHPSWLTAALLVIFWPGSTLPRFWKTESSQQPLPTQPSDAEGPLSSMAVYIRLVGAVVADSRNTTL